MFMSEEFQSREGDGPSEYVLPFWTKFYIKCLYLASCLPCLQLVASTNGHKVESTVTKTMPAIDCYKNHAGNL